MRRGLVLLVLVAGLVGCGGSDPAKPVDPTADDLVASGWIAFSDGRLDEAEGLFDEAIVLEPGHVDARVGLGWVAFRRGDHAAAAPLLAEALVLAGDVSTPEAQDALAGLALNRAADEADDPVNVRLPAETLLAANPAYVFEHDPSVAASDLHWLAARASLDLGDHEGVLPHLDALAPGHGLDPADPGFVEQALALLAQLAPLV